MPAQAITIEMSLNTPQQAFTNAPAGSYFKVTDIRSVAQLVTPQGEFMANVHNGVEKGKYLEIDVVGLTQLSNNCSGASQNNFILPLTNARIIGLTHRFRDDNVYATTTGDKAEIYNTANLREWKYNIGQYHLPIGDNFKVEDAVMTAALSMNDNTSYYEEDLPLEDFFDKQFVMRYSWQSSDEDNFSALNLVGTTGDLRLTTYHDLPPPPTSTSLLTSVYAHRTILVGKTIDIV